VTAPAFVRVPAARTHAQCAAILGAWGFAPAAVATAADALTWADLMGIDSHGIAMLPIYRTFLSAGRFKVAAAPRIERETPVSAVVDGDAGLGFHAAAIGMRLALEKARQSGIGIVAVRRSNHFGAAGYYALQAAEAGLVGLATTNVYTSSIVPTRGRTAMFGTNPIAFAAPTGGDRPFLLDMATSTVALGKLMTAAYRRQPIPEGWALGPDGAPTTDPELGYRSRLSTPLGGTEGLSSHKGTGLAAMVEILSAILPGATFAPLRAAGVTAGDVGHFFQVFDPALFRAPEEFRRDMDAMIAALRATPPLDPARPVLVAGDPEYAARAEREQEGIPLPETLIAALREVAAAADAPWLL